LVASVAAGQRGCSDVTSARSNVMASSTLAADAFCCAACEIASEIVRPRARV